MIARWNAVVGDGDLAYHLGDFSMSLGHEQRARGIFHRLHGRKILVLGNHDFRKPGVIHPTLAALEWATPPAPAMETTDNGHRVYLSHYAHRTWPGAQKGAFHFLDIATANCRRWADHAMSWSTALTWLSSLERSRS